MVIRTRRPKKRRHKSGVIKAALALILGFLIFLTYKQMNAGAKSLNEQIQTSASNGYSVISMDSADLSQGDLVLVNKDHPYSFPDSQYFVSIFDHKKDCYFVRDRDVMVGSGIMEHLNGLMEGFYASTGIGDVNVVSGWRNYELQQKLYDDSLVENGAVHTAEFIALPGCSEHHTGLAVDLSIYHAKTGKSDAFSGSGEYGWFADNSWKYGFVRRFAETKTSVTHVADEPWHYRYVGIPHAYYMTQNDLCLEEYIDLLRDYPYDGAHLFIDCAGQKYEVYYCAGMEIYAPEKSSHSVSGNNIDGFIVTVNAGNDK